MGAEKQARGWSREDFDPGAGPWLIRSHHWNGWHRRQVTQDGEEHAAGYTDDILAAGVFGAERARQYDDWGRIPGGRDEAVPVADVITQLEIALAGRQAEVAAFAEHVAAVRAAISKAQPPQEPSDEP